MRPPTLADIDAVLAIHSDPRTLVHNPGDALATRDEATGLCQRWINHWQQFGYGYWVVRGRRSTACLGFCGIKVVPLQGRSVLNLFYRFDPASWGDGIASEAASTVVTWAAEHVADLPVIARVRPDNVASQRVAVRAGLVRVEHLDGPGLDGHDWMFAANWS